VTEFVFNLLEFPGIHIEAVQPPIPAAVTHIDYSEEAVEYEKKLVQVNTECVLYFGCLLALFCVVHFIIASCLPVLRPLAVSLHLM